MANNISKRGLASLTPERRKEIARLGGLKSQASGKGHRFNSETAKLASELGVKAKRQSKTEDIINE